MPNAIIYSARPRGIKVISANRQSIEAAVQECTSGGGMETWSPHVLTCRDTMQLPTTEFEQHGYSVL